MISPYSHYLTNGLIFSIILQMVSISNNRKSKAVEPSKKTLSRSGTRVTGQRAVILDIIRTGKGHLDADEIYRQAREKLPHLSLSTVYRTLQKFKKLELIDELHLDDTIHHYEVRKTAEHHHLVCLGCGRVIEFSYPLANRIKTDVPEARDFEIVNDELRIKGYCALCRNKQK
jgi:Fur family ferric uptake transcriptional regulator